MSARYYDAVETSSEFATEHSIVTPLVLNTDGIRRSGLR